MGRVSVKHGVAVKGTSKRYALDAPIVEGWERAFATRVAFERARTLMVSLGSAEDRGYELGPRDPVFDAIFGRRA